MKASQKKKISKVLKKAWKAGKFKEVFPKEVKETPVEAIKKIYFILLMDNNERIRVIALPSNWEEVAVTIDYCLRTGETLTFQDQSIIMYVVGQEDLSLDTVNSKKIVAYSTKGRDKIGF